MWQRFTFYDLRIIGHYLGMLILFSAVLMMVPLITAFFLGEWEPATRYLFSIGIALIAGSILRFFHIEPGRLNARQALAVVGLAWIVLGLFCSIPLYFSGHYLNYLDAVFDGVSGLTTTGATLIQDLDHLSYADNMFRFMMHLLGGLGLIVVALSLGIFGKRAGSSLFKSEGRSESVVPNVINTTRFIAKLTAVFIIVATIIIGIIMLASGIEPERAGLQALWVSISGFVTGGFTPMQQSIMYYHSIVMEFFLMILMIAGAISFVLYSDACHGKTFAFFKDIETKTAFIWLVVMVIVFTSSLTSSTLFSDLFMLLRCGLFMMISAFTTTGFSVITTNQIVTVLSSGAFITIAITMAVGGGAGSTAGGIKIYRVGIIAKSIVSTIKEAIAPDSAKIAISYFHNGRRVLEPSVVKEAMTVFILYVVTYVIGALVGIAHGYDATKAIFESVAMTSNGGIITGIASPGMPISLELFYILQMWAGRLEFITLLALIAQIIAGAISRNNNRKPSQFTVPKIVSEHTIEKQQENVMNSADKADSSNDKPSEDKQDSSHKSVKTSTIATLTLCLVLALSALTPTALAFAQNSNDDIAEEIASQVEGEESDASDNSQPDTTPKVNNSVNPSQMPDSSFIYDASIDDIEHADSYMNGQTVQVVGEVVGDRIFAESSPDYCWITLQATDSSYAEVSVYMPLSSTSIIDMYGSYGKTGTRLQVRGIFNLACSDHNGISDLHAENVSLVAKGHEASIKGNPIFLAWGFLLCIASIVVMFIYYRFRERQR